MKKFLSIVLFIGFILVSNAQLNDTSTVVNDTLLNIDSLLAKKIFTIPYTPEKIKKLEKKTEIIAIKEPSRTKHNLFLILLNLITITVLLFNFSRLKVRKILATLFNINMLKQFSLVEIKRENKYLWAYFLLLLLYFAVLSYVLSFSLNKEVDVWYLSVIFSIFLLFDLLVNLVSSYILGEKENYAIVLFNNASFLILSIPYFILSIICIVFLPENFNFIFACLFFILSPIFYLLKEIRNILILGTNKIKVFSFYFFLYLCTFKILPLAVLVKTIFKELIK